MNEQIAQFGENNLLYGIVSLPDDASSGKKNPALIILNSGLLPRFGPNRLYVEMARAVAAVGNFVLRFDFSGVGESPAYQTELSYEARAKQEIQQALSYLEMKYGVQNFLLTGICSGADASFLAALQDKRIVGIVPIDFYSVSSKSYLIHSYKRRIFSPKSWLNFISGNSDLLNILKRVVNNITVFKTMSATKEKEVIEDSVETNTMNNMGNIREGYKKLFERKLQVYLIFSAGSPAYFNYNKQLKHIMAELNPGHILQMDFLETADHGFTFIYHQKLLVKKIQQWVEKFEAI